MPYDNVDFVPAMEEALAKDPRLTRDPSLQTYPPWYKRLMQKTLAQMEGTETAAPPAGPGAADPWNPVQTYQGAGRAARNLLGGFVPGFQYGGWAGKYGPEQIMVGEGGEEELVIPKTKWQELMLSGAVSPNALPPPPSAAVGSAPGPGSMPPPPAVAPPALPPSAPPSIAPKPPLPSELGPRPAGPAVQRYREQLQQGPPPMPKVPLWQNLLARGPGALAGYVNASGRTRVPMPSNDPVKMFHPGYGRKMEEYGQQLAVGKEAAGLEREQDKMDLAQQQAEAAMQANRATTALRERQTEALQSPTAPKAEAVGSFGYYDREGMWHPAPARNTVLSPGAVLLGPEGTPIYTAPTKEPAPRPTKASIAMEAAGGDPKKAMGYLGPPRVEKPQRAPQSVFVGIEKRKNDALKKLEKATDEAISAIRSQTFEVDETGKNKAQRISELNSEREKQKQQVQRQYEEEIVAAGGSVAATATQETPKLSVGQRVRLKDGKVVTVTKVNSDGTFDYE